jgi:hypothetical protein
MSCSRLAPPPDLHHLHRANGASRHHHRQHAIIDTVFSDLVDGPMTHLPSGQFASNGDWAICAAISHNLLRAAAPSSAAAMP